MTLSSAPGSIADPRILLRSISRYWWLVAILIVAGLAAGYVLASRQEPTYEATAQVVLKPERFQRLEAIASDDERRQTERSFDTERHILRSEAVVELALDELEGRLPSELRSPPEGADGAPLEGWQRARRLSAMISVQAVRGTSIVRVLAHCKEAESCPSVANAVVDAYVRFVQDRHRRTGVEAEDWLRARYLEVREQLETLEEEMIAYRRERGVLSLSLRDEFNTTGRSLQAVTAQLIELEHELDRMRTYAEYAEGVQNSRRFLSAGLPEVVGNSLVQELKSRLAQLQIERVSTGILLDTEHPRMRAIDEQVGLVESSIAREVSAEMETILLRVESAEALARELRRKADELREEAMTLETQQLEYERLQRQARRAAERFDALEERLNEVQLSNRLDAPQVEVLSRAREVRELNPIASTLFLGAGGLSGAAAGVLLAFLFYRRRATVASQEELETDFGLDVVGLLPRLRERDMREACDDVSPYLYPFAMPRSAFAEAAAGAFNHLCFINDGDTEKRCLLITSSAPQDGKTTAVVSLAFAISEAGKRCVVVDADLRRPQLARAFGVRPKPGVAEVVCGQTTWGKATQPSGFPGIDIFSAGEAPERISSCLHSEAFANTLRELRERYDFVLIDSPPLSAVADGIAISRCVDGMLLVARAEGTRATQLARTVDRLDALGAPLIGAVLNGVDINKMQASGYAYYPYYGTREEEVA